MTIPQSLLHASTGAGLSSLDRE
jgi:hypothetical protein